MRQEFIKREDSVFKQFEDAQISSSTSLEEEMLQGVNVKDIYQSEKFEYFLIRISAAVFTPIDKMTTQDKIISRESIELFSSAINLDIEDVDEKREQDFATQLERLKDFLTKVNKREIIEQGIDSSKYWDEVNSKEEQIKKEDNEEKKALLKNELGELLLQDIPQREYQSQGKISPSVLVDALRDRKRQIEEKQDRLMEIIEEEKVYFTERIKQAVKDGTLPNTALKFLNRINKVDASIIDGLVSLDKPYSGKCGDFDDIGINSFLMQTEYQPALRHIIRHEFIHNIAGEIINLYLNDNNDDKEVKFLKQGLGLKSPNKESLRGYGRWLNEGYTEFLNIKLFGDIDIEEKGAVFFRPYDKEVGIIKNLLKRGLDERLLMEAMFEVHHDKPSKGVGDKMIKLIREIDKLMGVGTFARLNNEDNMNLGVVPVLSSVHSYPIKDTRSLDEKVQQRKRIEFDIILGKGKGAVSKKFVYYTKENNYHFISFMQGLKKEFGAKIENIEEFN